MRRKVGLVKRSGRNTTQGRGETTLGGKEVEGVLGVGTWRTMGRP